MPSASTYVSVPATATTIMSALAQAETIAAERLGGSDGITLVSMMTLGEPISAIGLTFNRDWVEVSPEPAPDPVPEATP